MDEQIKKGTRSRCYKSGDYIIYRSNIENLTSSIFISFSIHNHWMDL